MDWIEVRDGFVKKENIIDIHVIHVLVDTWSIYLGLTSGQSVCYQTYDSEEEMSKALTGLLNLFSANVFFQIEI